MYVQTDAATGRPLVADLSSPRTVVRVTDTSEYHLTVELVEEHRPQVPCFEGRDIPLQLVLTREVAAQLVDRIMDVLTGGEPS